ncbi:MAG: hypothetical protein QNJ38_23845 [Prochloraceae cyanobacterium]|nr:hypothetical protein [Prochloraceae cyanobacterium]
MKKELKNKTSTREWSVKLRVSPEEEKQIKMRAIKMSMGIAKYIKQAALEEISSSKPETQGKFN